MPNLLKLHRRDFITAMVALTTSRAAGGIKGAPESAPMTVSSANLSIPASHPNIASSAHIAEIARRNLLRQESGLPLLSVPKELRRIKTAEGYARFAKFSEVFRKRVQQKMLARTQRRRIGDPNWVPKGMMAGMAFEYEVSRNLARVYERVGKCG